MKIKPKQISSLLLFTVILCITLFIFSGCAKKKNDTASPGTSTYYYKATIGGKQYNQTVTNTNGYIAGSSLGGTDDVTVSADISPEADPQPAGTTSLDITKGILHNYLALSNAQFFQYFAPGTYVYTTGPDYDPYANGDGFIISWFDENGTEWNTSSGTGDQTGSTIKIISVQDAQAPLNYYVMVKLQFSCKLYNSNTGEMKQLTNGEFVGLFGKI